MINISKAKIDDVWLSEPGAWRRSVCEGGKISATVSCPDCGRSCSLSSHEIAQDGTVTPSLVCPLDDCDFHKFAKLEDWTG